MTFGQLVARSLRYFWRTNLAVVLGVAVAVGVLTGALLVGDSVRGSLRELFLARLGNTESVIVANTFFRDALAEEMGPDTVPLIAFEGMLTHEASGRRRAHVQVYGVDARFWAFHGVADPELSRRGATLTPSLVEELGSGEGDTLLLRVEQPSAVSRGSLHGFKENTGRTLRLTQEAAAVPEFSLYPQQDSVKAIFLPLSRLQRDLGQEGTVNTILLSGRGDAEPKLQETATLSDLGVRLRALDSKRGCAIESHALMLSDPVVRAVRDEAAERGLETTSILTYLANTLRVGEREVPYSLVTALDSRTYESLAPFEEILSPSLVLNEWAASDLEAKRGDALTMEYYLWRDDGLIETESAEFIVDAVIPMEGFGTDREVAPEFPGISSADNLGDWEPPFPIDLRRVRDKDEEYWDAYRTSSKAFIRLARGQRIWPVRQGKLTSIRVSLKAEDAEAFERGLRARLDPLALGFSVIAARAEGVRASEGATDFGEYFVYFSYFLVVAALMLTGLFFKLGVEQRLREIGTLVALGFPMQRVRRLFTLEGVVLSVIGGLAGIVIAVSYGWLIMYGLRTWWVDAVGTRLLTLHVSALSLFIGVVGGGGVAAIAIAWTLRHLEKIPPRNLLAGETGRETSASKARSSRRASRLAWSALALGLLLVAGASTGVVNEVAGFFGAGNLLLVSLLLFQWLWLKAESKRVVSGQGTGAMARLGFRNATYRPGRSLVAVALIAFASFTIVAVDGFRKNDRAVDLARDSGSGGYPLMAESLLPLHWDPNTLEGRDAVGLPYPGDPDALDLEIQTFRLRPGDDASCLNLYRPQNPRLLAASGAFIEEGRFRFSTSLAETPEEKANPWLLLRKSFSDGAVPVIPVIGDANSMTYVLHLGLGEDFLLSRAGETPLRLRLVATLADSIFQSELLSSEENFLAHFPEADGFRFFLVDTPAASADEARELLEGRLADFGLDVQSTSEKLAGYHRVENTYLSTFQTLGGLGLVLGTFGLAAVLLRNVLERRRELALLRAVGYENRHFSIMIAAENGLLLFLGLLTGSLAALVAIAPALVSRGGSFGGGFLGVLLGAVVVSGLLSSFLAVAAVFRTPLLANLRAE